MVPRSSFYKKRSMEQKRRTCPAALIRSGQSGLGHSAVQIVLPDIKSLLPSHFPDYKDNKKSGYSKISDTSPSKFGVNTPLPKFSSTSSRLQNLPPSSSSLGATGPS